MRIRERRMDLTPEQQSIRDAVQKLCVPFDDDYWLERDRSEEFPFDFAGQGL